MAWRSGEQSRKLAEARPAGTWLPWAVGPGAVDRGAVLVYGDQVKVLAPPTSLDIVLADNKLIVGGYI